MLDSILKKDANLNVERLKRILEKRNSNITQNDVYKIVSEKISNLQQQIDALLKISTLLFEGYKQIDKSTNTEFNIPIIKTEGAHFTDKIYSKSNQTFTKEWRFKESKGVGTLQQIFLKTDSDQFRVYFTIDDDVHYDDTYTFFSNNSKNLAGISAYLDNGYYYLSIQNIPFQKHFTLRIVPLVTTITFDVIFIKYIIRDEIYLKI